jgi:hypothetical protein
MAKLTQHDRDLKDSRKVKTRVLNLKKMTTSIVEKDYLILTRQDNSDLQEINKILDTMISRYEAMHI